MKLFFIAFIFLFSQNLFSADPCQEMLSDGSWDVRGAALKVDNAIKAKCDFSQNKKCKEMWFADPMPLLSCAVISKNTEIVKKIIASGADPNTSDIKGVTPLMYAAQFPAGPKTGETHVRILLNAGANKFAKDKKGRDAISHAGGNLGAVLELIVDDFEKKNICEFAFHNLESYRKAADHHKIGGGEATHPEIKKKWDAMRAQLKIYGTTIEGFKKKCGKTNKNPEQKTSEKEGASK